MSTIHTLISIPVDHSHTFWCGNCQRNVHFNWNDARNVGGYFYLRGRPVKNGSKQNNGQ